MKPEVPMRSVLADILSKFDGQERRGINFHLAGSSSACNSMCDTRHVHFGIDDGYLSDWEDRGKPWVDKVGWLLPGGKPSPPPDDLGKQGRRTGQCLLTRRVLLRRFSGWMEIAVRYH